MTTWILIWILTNDGGYPGNPPMATASAVFHSQKSCKEAAAHFIHGNIALCLEDKVSTDTVKGQ